MIDTPRLKEVVRSNIRQLAEALYPNGKFHHGEWRVGNVAGDPGDSLGIRLVGSKAGLGIDRASGEAGDFIYFVRGKHGFGFREAVEWVGRTLGVSFEISDNDGEQGAGEKKTLSGPESKLEAKPLRQPLPVSERSELSAEQHKRMALAAHRLAPAPEKIFSVLGDRSEISLEAVRGCALEGDLGFEDDCHFYDQSGPAILFGYSYGVKARWAGVDGRGKKIVRWIAGGPAKQCWRQSLLRTDHTRIYFVEGETDALTGLSLGLEDEDSHCLVVGLTSATILPKPETFSGRSIIILSDPDNAGTGAAEKLAGIFSSIAPQVAIVSLGTEAEGAVC
jgi:hypothetical protein